MNEWVGTFFFFGVLLRTRCWIEELHRIKRVRGVFSQYQARRLEVCRLTMLCCLVPCALRKGGFGIALRCQGNDIRRALVWHRLTV